MKNKNNRTLLVLIGAPGSGKSTFAKYHIRTNLNWFRISRDDIRLMQFGKGNLSEEQEMDITSLVNASIEHLLSNRTNVVMDATNIKMEYLNSYIEQFQPLADIEFRVFDEPLEVLKDRCRRRHEAGGRYIPKRVIERHHQAVRRLMERSDLSTRPKLPSPKLEYVDQKEAMTSAIICDLDGTLSLMNGRNPYDAAACENDLLNEPIAEIVKTYHNKGDKIILLSGRSEQFKPQTERWLAKHDIPYDLLLMRKKRDFRKDSEMKLEIVNEHLLGKYFIRFVLDDRNSVVDMWRKELGLPCLQVNYGNF